MSEIGVLLTNLGTPDAPTPSAVRRYLAEFLSDPRVIEISPFIWKIILYGFVLPWRSRMSAKLYQKIWTPEGSPLRIILEQQAQKLRNVFSDQLHIITAMRYGKPSIAEGMKKLQALKIKKLLLFSLYPQYSAATNATTFDAIAAILKTWRFQPELRVINGYHRDENYIQAVAGCIGQTEKLLFSFHGLPKSFVLKGDPYYEYCQETATLIAKKLGLAKTAWDVSFQSRLGRAEWLKPYTDQLLKLWASQGIKAVSVVCPGFSADCLETLEEIQEQNKKIFIDAGGVHFHYVPALNATDSHMNVLANLIRQHTQGWVKL